jgi:hypothetical protein
MRDHTRLDAAAQQAQADEERVALDVDRVNNFKATDRASVSKVIHTDNQLHAGQFGKTAYTEWIHSFDL